jgi:crotonobetainyl-CoA:carnitine CoA-transferase CaiB-like acyl-CoA transferase
MSHLPLRGVRVLDLAKLIPGDLATRRLADLGADVVKVESRERPDYLRYIGMDQEGRSPSFINLNRNKRSIAIDLTTPEGLALFHQLADVADAIVEVSVPGRMLSQGIDFAAMRARRPELVICSVTGFGLTGPLANLPSHGMSLDALAALMNVVPTPNGPAIDMRLGVSLASEVGATNAALAIVAALFEARTTGHGAWIDASCWDAGAEMSRNALCLSSRGVVRPRHLGQGIAALYSVYPCSDSHLILVAAIEKKFSDALFAGLGRPDLATLTHLHGQPTDWGDVAELREALASTFARDTATAWMERLQDLGVPCAVVLEDHDLYTFPHTSARGLVEADFYAGYPLVKDPIRWADDGSRPGDEATPPPEIGEHTHEVLAEWLVRPASER